MSSSPPSKFESLAEISSSSLEAETYDRLSRKMEIEQIVRMTLEKITAISKYGHINVNNLMELVMPRVKEQLQSFETLHMMAQEAKSDMVCYEKNSEIVDQDLADIFLDLHNIYKKLERFVDPKVNAKLSVSTKELLVKRVRESEMFIKRSRHYLSNDPKELNAMLNAPPEQPPTQVQESEMTIKPSRRYFTNDLKKLYPMPNTQPEQPSMHQLKVLKEPVKMFIESDSQVTLKPSKERCRIGSKIPNTKPKKLPVPPEEMPKKPTTEAAPKKPKKSKVRVRDRAIKTQNITDKHRNKGGLDLDMHCFTKKRYEEAVRKAEMRNFVLNMLLLPKSKSSLHLNRHKEYFSEVDRTLCKTKRPRHYSRCYDYCPNPKSKV